MQRDVVDKISNKVKLLSAEQQEEILEFVERFEPPKPRTLWEMWKGHLKDIPQAEIDKLPVDGAKNHDHYLYGAPKK